MTTDWQTLNNPRARTDVIKAMIDMSSKEDLISFATLMVMPAITPTEDAINDPNHMIKWHAIEIAGKPGYLLSYCFYAGVGSLFVHISPTGAHTWADALPGEGADARQRYLEGTVKMAFEAAGKPVQCVEQSSVAPLPKNVN